MKEVKVDDISLSNESNFALIAGLNVLEDEGIVNEVTEELKKVTKELGIPFIFKASYDKAARATHAAHELQNWLPTRNDKSLSHMSLLKPHLIGGAKHPLFRSYVFF